MIRSMSCDKKKLICVVGAGAAGLPAIRHSLLYGFDVVCYEAQAEIGGLWRFNPDETEYSSVMRSTVINTSKEFTAYSDFPPTAEEPNFMHNTRMLHYLRSYARHFKLDEHIRLGHKVLNISRAQNYTETGQWNVQLRDMKSGTVSVSLFDGVLHCTGHHSVPYVPPKWPGQETFKGRVIHAHDYKDFKSFEDQSIVVVGVGNSGCDIAVELSRVAKQVHLVSRRGTWVFNRIHDYGRPVDCARYTRMSHAIKSIVPQSIASSIVRRQLNKRFDHELYGLKPAHGVSDAHPTINDELPNRIANGSIRVRPGIRKFSGEKKVEFEDGSMAEGVDTVILATGYSVQFPEIEEGGLLKISDNRVDLFQYVFPQSLQHDTLAVIGLVQPFGSIIPIAEMQVRVALDVISGTTKLPSKEDRLLMMQRKSQEMSDRYVKSRRHTVQVDYLPYMDELAALIGCEPPAWYSYLRYDAALAYRTLITPHAAYFYRLRGPHAWEGARDAIMGVEERIRRATHSNFTSTTKSKGVSARSFLAIIALFTFLLTLFQSAMGYRRVPIVNNTLRISNQ